jgi:hypothetical protein
VPGPEAPASQRMKYRLRTAVGRAQYKLRQQTVEPVFGIINLKTAIQRAGQSCVRLILLGHAAANSSDRSSPAG